MREKPTREPVEVVSSLEDSTYELLGDSVASTSDDDDGQTASLESNDGHTLEDVTSLADTDQARNGSAVDLSIEQARDDEPAAALLHNDAEELNGMESGLTIKAHARAKGGDMDDTVIFEEPKVNEDQNEVTVSHLLYHCEEPQMPDTLRAYGWPRIDVIVKQSMSKQLLVLERPYRILYIGEPAFLNTIIPKIASALAAGVESSMDSQRGSSRYNVIPVSGIGGDGLPSEVEVIESSGIDLVVDECTNMTSYPSYIRPGRCYLGLELNNKGAVLISNGEFKTIAGSPWSGNVPDLVVFFHSSTRSDTAHRYASKSQPWNSTQRSALSSCAIPTIDISEELLFRRCPPAYEYSPGSLHVSIEHHGSENNESAIPVLEKLPVDLLTFSEMDPLQLNRHLARLVPHREQSLLQRLVGWPRDRLMPKIKAIAEEAKNMVDEATHGYGRKGTVYKEMHAKLSALPVKRWHAAALLSGFILLLVSTMLVPYLQCSQGVGKALTAYHKSSAVVQSPTSVHSPASVSSPTPVLPSLSQTKTPNSGKAVAKSNTEKSLGQPMTNPLSPTANDSPDFKIRSVRDNVVSLVPPKRLTDMRKPPQLFARVMRGDELVATQINKSIDGMYLVTLKQEQTYGKLNLTVWTKSKPEFHQSFNLNFGNRYLKPYVWSKAVDKVSDIIGSDVAIVQEDFRKVSSQISASTHEAVKRIDAGIKAMGHTLLGSAELTHNQATYYARRAAVARKTILQHLVEKHNALSQQTRKLCQSVKNVDVARTWQNVPSVRKSNAMNRAHKNAVGLMEKLKQKKSARAARREATAADKITKKAKRVERKAEKARKRAGRKNMG